MKKKMNNERKRMWAARRQRVIRKISVSDRPRLTVFRSSKHIYAQLVDPVTGQTIGAVSTLSKSLIPDGASTKDVAAAKKVGAAIAKLAESKQISEVVFNRNGFLYHGRIKALAEAAREAGLQF